MNRGGSETLEEATRTRLLQGSTASVTTELLMRGFRNCAMAGLAPLNPNRNRFAGAAYTLRFLPAREDLSTLESLSDPEHPQRKSIETTPSGEVLVVDGRGLRNNAAFGGIMVLRLAKRGVAGLVADCGMRDAAEIAGFDFPVFCAGPAAPASVTNLLGIDLQRPIACGGVTVFPGDVIMGDGDGVVVIPRHLAKVVAEAAAERERFEAFIQSKIAEGRPLPGTYPPNDALKAEYAALKRET